MEPQSFGDDLRQVIEHGIRFGKGRLAEFAFHRHGFGDTDGGFGVTYPGDLDEYMREVEGIDIPEGFIQIYGYWGPPEGFEHLISERDFLITVEAMLAERGCTADAARVRSILTNMQ